MSKFCSLKKIKILALCSSFILLSGNFIKYPEKISTGWDATLSHLSFYGLRTQMLDYIKENQIPFKDISSGFGISGIQNRLDLTSPENCVIKNVSFFDKSDYFIYSNVSNLNDSIIDRLRAGNGYVQVKNFEKGNVFISLYRKQ
jgi:hypothetical protein